MTCAIERVTIDGHRRHERSIRRRVRLSSGYRRCQETVLCIPKREHGEIVFHHGSVSVRRAVHIRLRRSISISILLLFLPFASAVFSPADPWRRHWIHSHFCPINTSPQFYSHSHTTVFSHCIVPRPDDFTNEHRSFFRSISFRFFFFSFWHSGVFEYARVQRSRITVILFFFFFSFLFCFRSFRRINGTTA